MKLDEWMLLLFLIIEWIFICTNILHFSSIMLMFIVFDKLILIIRMGFHRGFEISLGMEYLLVPT